ncbi:MAG: hypothetical protein GVY22_03975 [Gammaproteobacteria bacterium]|jgi:hypothetical protein|nr:hypothetical protein [Gammaproteobacteria bacterium]
MIRRPAILALLLAALAPSAAAECPGADRLTEALRLVERSNPVLRAERATAAEQRRQRDWSAEVSVGYSITETLETGAAGPNARLNIRIPLFDRSAKLEQAKDAAALTASTDALRAALIADIQALCEQAHQVRALERRREFTQDRLSYRQERVDQGLDPAGSLWSEAEAMQTASHEAQRAAANLAAARLALAREYAGQQWQRLQTLLEAMTQ